LRILSGAFWAANSGTRPVARTRAVAVARPKQVRHAAVEETVVIDISSDSEFVEDSYRIHTQSTGYQRAPQQSIVPLAYGALIPEGPFRRGVQMRARRKS
jgi:hypothetical protein